MPQAGQDNMAIRRAVFPTLVRIQYSYHHHQYHLPLVTLTSTQSSKGITQI